MSTPAAQVASVSSVSSVRRPIVKIDGTANVLVPPGSVADISNTPTSKSVVIRLQRSVIERAG